jgi:hypothetical protein
MDTTPVNVDTFEARLTNAGVPWRSCYMWKIILNQLAVYGSNALQYESCKTMLAYGVPPNKLPLFIGVHHLLDKLIGRVLNGDTQDILPLDCNVMRDIRSQYAKAIVDASEKDIIALGVNGDDPAIGFNQWLLEVPPIGYGRSHFNPRDLWLSKSTNERMSQRGTRDPDYRPWRLQKAKELAHAPLHPLHLPQTH